MKREERSIQKTLSSNGERKISTTELILKQYVISMKGRLHVSGRKYILNDVEVIDVNLDFVCRIIGEDDTAEEEIVKKRKYQGFRAE